MSKEGKNLVEKLAAAFLFVMAVGMAVPASTWYAAAEEDEVILYGDVNRDGKIDSEDISALRTAINQKITEGYEQGDVNGDGVLSTKDISMITSYIDGEIAYFPVGDVYRGG